MANLIFGSSFKGIEKELTDWYCNPNDFQDMTKQLHVCETLFGDFNAKLMILLQDAADEETLIAQKIITPNSPLRHSPKISTNKKLVKWFKEYFKVDINGGNSRECGIYYANAIWLIKKGSDISSPIYLQNKVLGVCAPVLDATINNLQELKLILTFGKSAFLALKSKFNIQESWEDALANNVLIDVGERFKVGVINHPRASVSSMLTKVRINNLLIESKII